MKNIDLLRKSKVIEEYTQFHHDTDWTKHAHEHNAPELSHHFHGLAEEVGEAVGVFKKITRLSGYRDVEEFLRLLNHHNYMPKLIEEMGDIIWYYNKILEFIGMDIESIMIFNTYKLWQRHHDRPEFRGVKWPFSNPSLNYDVLYKQFGTVDND